MRIGIIGVGVMGMPIADRLAGAGHDLIVCDVAPEARDRFAGRAGVATTATPSTCAAADAVIALVATDQQVRDVSIGNDGVLGAIDPARPPTMIVMSTVGPSTVRELSERLAAVNTPLLDAPISGGLDGARNGTLSIMVGGRPEVFDRMRPLFEEIGGSIAYCGPVGHGVTTKILNNLIGVANWILTAEAMALGTRLGMDTAALAAIMDGGSGRNLATGNWPSRQALYRYYVDHPELLAANRDICRKDLSLVLELANESGIALPLTRGLADAIAGVPSSTLQRIWSEIERPRPE
ncbi:MAG: NAD(P)-dependent oxidoreductase [Lautropia sp.]